MVFISYTIYPSIHAPLILSLWSCATSRNVYLPGYCPYNSQMLPKLDLQEFHCTKATDLRMHTGEKFLSFLHIMC